MSANPIRTEKQKSTFDKCREIDVSDIIETSYSGARYISWAHAWTRLKENFPFCTWITHEFEDSTGQKVPYLKTEFGVFVRVSITIEGITLTEDLTVMDNKMQAIMDPDGRDILDTIKRCGVKAMALHGFGIECWFKDDHHQRNSDGWQKKKNEDPFITTDQAKKLFAIAKQKSIPNEAIKDILNTYGYQTSIDIQKIHFDKILKQLEEFNGNNN